MKKKHCFGTPKPTERLPFPRRGWKQVPGDNNGERVRFVETREQVSRKIRRRQGNWAAGPRIKRIRWVGRILASKENVL